ncbi:hypothetical protein [Leucothrix pacifica]|uniref:Uncharacterized protein n=1 Tax=Leucothrix pacifica TaxID=1247513 RepID=A0A317C0R3_9GAMM|nr:hypothetical protein [Leucothrix pacifica]PWQ92244.1 hypothetical protein DKW60_22095 [Leucothrix pacifica]
MNHTQNWFVWNCFIEEENLPPTFIYGYAVETFIENNNLLTPQTEQLIAGRKVYFVQEIVSPRDFRDRFTSESLEIAEQVIPVYFQKNVIQQRLGHYAPASLSLTVKNPKELSERLGESDEFIAALLATLEKRLVFPFGTKNTMSD